MTGDARTVSAVLLVLNQCIGFPITVNHGAFGNVFVEYDGSSGPVTLATANGAAGMLVITILMSEDKTEQLIKQRLLDKFGPEVFFT